MRKIEDIPKIKIDPKTSDHSSPEVHRPDKTVCISDDELDIKAGEGNAANGIRLETLEAQYTILDKVGGGGMGIVYLAQDRKLGRYVAIKRLNRASLSNPVLKERFFREAKAVAALNHIHIVHMYGLGEDTEGPYIVMEYVPGPPETSPGKTPPRPFTLADRVEISGPLSLDDALDLMLKICKAIEYSHNCRVIHRDLKPSNVLLDESGEPKLADFGLALRTGQNEEHLTLPGEKMLSVGYGAPEQELDASQTDQRADVYGLGAILYFSITGKNPRYFRESEVPESLRMPLVKALEIDRNYRWSTVKEFTAALLLVKAPSAIIPPAAIKITWRCKWCDTVNPLTISYCGKCGWDGSEACAECGADTRVGIQFCGSCGADAREYEIANNLLKHIQRHWEEKSFELVIHEAGRSGRFQPTGTNGRKLLVTMDRMGKDAQKAITQRRELKETIDREMSLQNYDLVQKCTEEYNRLSTDNSFEELIKELPSLILNSKLKKARKAVDQREFDYAKRLCRDIIESNPNNCGEAEFIIRVIKSQRLRTRAITTAVISLLLLCLYILSAAPVYLLTKNRPSPVFNSIYGFAYFLYDSTILQKPLEKYADFWHAGKMYEQTRETETNLITPPPAKIGNISSLQTDYLDSLAKLETAYTVKSNACMNNYSAELKLLQSNMQRKGDFEGWSAIRDELSRVENDKSIPEEPSSTSPAELNVLQKKFRENRTRDTSDMNKERKAISQHYIGKLKNLQRNMTMKNKMDEAAAINTEIKRIQTVSELSDDQPDQSAPKNSSIK